MSAAAAPRTRRRPRRILAALAITALTIAFLLGTEPGRIVWCTALYPVLVWFNVDRWFPATAEIPLLDVSGPDVAQAGSPARGMEVAKIGFIAGRFTDIDFGCRILDPGSGPSVRVRVRTWHPLQSRRLADSIRRAYLDHATDPGARLAAEFVTAPPVGTGSVPPSVDFPPPVPGVPWEPEFDATAQLVLRAGTNAVPRLLDIATRANPGWYNHLEAHILLCKILDIRPRGADDEWCGIRAADWTAHRRDAPDVRAIWTPYLETASLPATPDGFYAPPAPGKSFQ